MRITVHQTQAVRSGIADLRPVGVLAPAPVRPSVTRRAHAALTRRRSTRSTGPAVRRRTVAPSRSRAMVPATSATVEGDTLVVTVVRPRGTAEVVARGPDQPPVPSDPSPVPDCQGRGCSVAHDGCHAGLTTLGTARSKPSLAR